MEKILIPKMTVLNDFLSIRDSFCWAMTCRKVRNLWLSTRLYLWLEELFVIEFDHNGYFYVHFKNHVLRRRLYQKDIVHHGVTAGTTFAMTRKVLMSKRNILLAFSNYELQQKVWITDVIWNRYVPHCDSRDHDFCNISTQCYGGWFRKFHNLLTIRIMENFDKLRLVKIMYTK